MGPCQNRGTDRGAERYGTAHSIFLFSPKSRCIVSALSRSARASPAGRSSVAVSPHRNDRPSGQQLTTTNVYAGNVYFDSAYIAVSSVRAGPWSRLGHGAKPVVIIGGLTFETANEAVCQVAPLFNRELKTDEAEQ